MWVVYKDNNIDIHIFRSQMAPKKITPVPIVPEDTLVPVQEDIVSIIAQKLSEIQALSKEVIILQKTLQKDYVRLQKLTTKKGTKGGAVKKAPSGFAKPAKLSDELCLFLGIEKGSELPRTDVTRRLNVYIKEKQLQNPENKKNIIPDAPLKTLLRLEATDVLSYFNLQRYMKHLFVQL